MDESTTASASTDLALLAQQLTRYGKLLNAHHQAAEKAGLGQSSQQLLNGLLPAEHLVQRLERKLSSQTREQQRLFALRDLSALVNSSLDIEEVLTIVMDSIIALTGAERAFLMLRDELSGELVVRAARNVERESIATSEFSFSRSVVRRVADTGEGLLTTDAQDDPRLAGKKSVISFNLRSILCVPLKTRERLTGVIYVDNRVASGIFHDEDRDLLGAFAHQAALAVENARLFRQTHDHLGAIVEMKRLMDDVFSSIPSGVITIDAADQITLVNRAARRILCLPQEEALGAYPTALAPIAAELTPLLALARLRGATAAVEFDVLIAGQPDRMTLSVTCAPLEADQDGVPDVAVVVEDVSQKKRLDSVRRYLPPALVDHIVDVDAAQHPERRRITTLFADIRNFSGVSERLAPETLVQVINRYFTVAAEAINAYEGVIDKFMGDAVMATFNTTLNPQETDHVARAVRAALQIRDQVSAHHDEIDAEHRLHFGIGLHVGDAVVGNVGSQFRKDYSAIGDAVNLARRLQEMAAPQQILISQDVVDQVQGWVRTRLVGEVRTKGRSQPVIVYELEGVL